MHDRRGQRGNAHATIGRGMLEQRVIIRRKVELEPIDFPQLQL